MFSMFFRLIQVVLGVILNIVNFEYIQCLLIYIPFSLINGQNNYS